MFVAKAFTVIAGVLIVALSGCVDGGPPEPSPRSPQPIVQRMPELAADGGRPDQPVDASEPERDEDAAGRDHADADAGHTSPLDIQPCDGAPGITFSAAAIGGGIPLAGTQVMSENGYNFIIVDGTCRFWAQSARLMRVVTGQLSHAELASLREEFELDRWRSCRGTHSDGASDAPEYHFTYGRNEHVTGNIDDCFATPSTHAHEPGYLLKAYQRVLGRLVTAGTPADGDIRYLLVQNAGTQASESIAAWPLGDAKNVAIGQLAASNYERGSSRLATGAEAETLRELWQGFLDEHLKTRAPGALPYFEGIPIEHDGARYTLFLRDTIPLEDARGLITY